MQNRAVVSLAILSVNFNESTSYLDNFVPLVAECIRLGDDDVVSLPALQQKLQSDFGLRIPQNVIQSILRRVQAKHYIYYSDRVFYRDSKALEKSTFRQVQQSVLRAHGELIRCLVQFADEHFALHWTTEQAEAGLQDFMEDNEVAILAGTRDGVIAPDAVHVPHSRFVVARFAQHLQDEHTGNFDYFETIVKGSMLASAIFLPDPERAAARFEVGERNLLRHRVPSIRPGLRRRRSTGTRSGTASPSERYWGESTVFSSYS